MLDRKNLQIVEVKEIEDKDLVNNLCNVCNNKKSKFVLKVGNNNFIHSVSMCSKCLDTLYCKIWDVNAESEEDKVIKVVRPTVMRELPMNCYDCECNDCVLPVDSENKMNKEYKYKRHEKCNLKLVKYT